MKTKKGIPPSSVHKSISRFRNIYFESVVSIQWVANMDSVTVSIESLQEFQVQEVSLDGQETYTKYVLLL